MSTSSPAPEDLHQGVAAILLGMSQTPPRMQKIANPPESTASPRSLKQHPTTLPSTPEASQFKVPKISNSDDEDEIAPAWTVSDSPLTILDQQYQTQQIRGTPSAQPQTVAGPARSVDSTIVLPAAYVARKLAAPQVPDRVLLYKSPYPVIEPEYGRPPAAREPSRSDCPGGACRSAHLGAPPVPREQFPSMMHSTELSSYPGDPLSIYQNGAAVPSRFLSVPPLFMRQPSYEGSRISPTLDRADREVELLTQLLPQDRRKPPPSNTPATNTQLPRHSSLPAGRFDQRSRLAHTPLQRPPLGAGNESLAGLPEGVRGRKRGRLPRVSSKHVVSPTPRSSSPKRPRTDHDSDKIKIEHFKYRTIKAINMPVQDNLAPSQDTTQLSEGNLPYGDDMDLKTSWIIYWLDEEELTYSETTRLFKQMFPGESANDDTVRKKHMKALEHLANKYGLRPEEDLATPGKNVTRRGQQAGHKFTTIGGKAIYGGHADVDYNGRVRAKRTAEPLSTRGFLLACLCVWKDTCDMSFNDIQERFEKKYHWKLGVNTVQKLYYSERARVYDTYGEALRDLPIEKEETDGNTGAVDGEGAVQRMAGEIAAPGIVDTSVACSYST